MSIRVNLDVMMARCKMSLNEPAKRVNIILSDLSILKNRQGACGMFYDTRYYLQGARLPAGGYTRIPKRLSTRTKA